MTNPIISTENTKLDTIQVHRGLASIFVLLFHATVLMKSKESYTLLNDIFSIGFLGVDFFFVLSGFIIYYVHSIDIATPNKLWPYIKKRFFRLYPIFWLVAIPIIIMSAINPASSIKNVDNSLSGIASTLLLMPQSGNPALPVSWSMKYELLFYCLFGFLIFFNKKISLIILIIWITLTTANQFLPQQYLPQFRSHYICSLLLSDYNFEFLMGALVAYAIKNKKPSANLIYLLVILIAVAVFIFNCLYFKNNIDYNRVLLAGIPFSLLIYGTAGMDIHRHTEPDRGAFYGALMFLGNASYSIYLIHYPLLSAAYKLMFKYGITNTVGPFATAISCIAIAIAGGCILHKFIEQPVLGFLRRNAI